MVAYGGVRADLMFGEPEGGESERTERLLEMFEKAGLPAELRTDMPVVQWEKFVAICGTGGVLTLLRLPMGPTFDCPESGELFLGVMKEIEALARARGVALSEGSAVRRYQYFKENADPSTRSSTLMDLEAGRRLELESLAGTAESRRSCLVVYLGCVLRMRDPHRLRYCSSSFTEGLSFGCRAIQREGGSRRQGKRP